MGVVVKEERIYWDESASLKLFYHVISGPESNYEKMYRERVGFDDLNVAARTRGIANKGFILGRPKGLFIKSVEKSQWGLLESVSLSLADIKTLTRCFSARASSSAIVFNHSALVERGAKPVIHIETGQTRPRFNEDDAYIYDVVQPNYDFRWENEWRVRSKLEVSNQTVAFFLTDDSAFSGYSLDVQFSPIHRAFWEPYILIPEDYDGLLDLSFSVPFIHSSLITDPRCFFREFVAENYEDYFLQLLFERALNDFGGHYPNSDALHDLLQNPVLDVDLVGNVTEFQSTFLEYVYLLGISNDENVEEFEERANNLKKTLIWMAIHAIYPEITKKLGYNHCDTRCS